MIGLSVAGISISSAREMFWTIPTRFLTGVAGMACGHPDADFRYR
ncbi:TPA: hypothetical protein ACUNF5_003875 [Burkholderia orbicola]|nr:MULTISPECIES: hypothetical protein [Burkholderia cepacia complex]MEB2607218.1 hypothetical protein [Burkholderia cenocepacia]WJN72132.1 hypothetical protein OH687_39045 [Burkholderia anthina]